MTKTKRKKRVSPIPLPAAIIFGLCGLGTVVYFICTISPEFADAVNATAGHFIRVLLSKIFAIFPFSFMEYLLFSSPFLIAGAIYIALRIAKSGGIYIIRAVCAVLSVAAGVFFLFTVSFAPGYRTTPIANKVGLIQKDVSPEELYSVTLIMTEKLEGVCKEIEFSKEGYARSPYSLKELSKMICTCYSDVEEDYGIVKNFSSEIKPLIISPLMTYTHISGIYSFFTGEANLNTNYPDFINVYTTAHEMAHQRGISREDEANFAAFLALESSDDPYLRYCAYLNMYQYLSSALFSADAELWRSAASDLPNEAKAELRAYSVFFDKYRESAASEVSDALNDAYLESQGTAGVKSYGMVVDLAVAYYLD